jgi:exodeoxyribonuclease V beta subunit
LHDLFEHFDYTQVGDAALLAQAVDEMLTSYGLPTPTASAEAKRAAAEFVRIMVERTLSDPIPSAQAALSTVLKEHSFREWRFQMPMEGISAKAIAAVLKQHGEPWLAGYAASLERTSQQTLDGILTGIVDLVCVIDHRWWIIDWKSNTLGPTAAAYDDAGCRRAMMREHFVLQYHVYVVALHRFLRSRLSATYDYERHFGGVGYAFLRGLAAGAPAWFNDRPSRALVEALDAAIGGYAQ